MSNAKKQPSEIELRQHVRRGDINSKTFKVQIRSIVAQGEIADAGYKIGKEIDRDFTFDFKESEMQVTISKVGDLATPVVFKCESSREHFAELLQLFGEYNNIVRHGTFSALAKAMTLCIYPHTGNNARNIAHATKLGIKCTCGRIKHQKTV